MVVLFEDVKAFLECGMGGEPGEKGVVACPFAEATEEGDHRLEADATGDAEPNGVVVGLALKMARVASLNQDGGEGASGGEEGADVAEEEADEEEKTHFS